MTLLLRYATVHLAQPRIDLATEIERLETVRRSGAHEAVLLYCGRILEVLSDLASQAATSDASGNVYGNLCRLEEVGFLASTSATLFHALRRLTNEARHVLRDIREGDVELATSLLERFLGWYLCRFPLGPRARVPLGVRTELAVVLGELESARTDAVDRFWTRYRSAVHATPIPASLYSELLIGRARADEALAVAADGLAAFPDDLRLRQIHAWSLRRVGRVDEAIALLEALALETPRDPETLGLLAGALKERLAIGGSARNRQLGRLLDLYRRAWKASDRRSTYAGINAAGAALWVGDAEGSRRLATEVLARFECRRGVAAPGRAIAFASYWDHATWAEALLLSGDLEAARREYRAAFASHPELSGHRASTIRQLTLHLPALGLGPGVEAFLAERTLSVTKPETYEPRPLDTTAVQLPDDLNELGELLAEHVHDVWAQGRKAEGWRHGPERDDATKEHPDLVPYAALPDEEKAYDRSTATETLKAILAMGYRIERT